MSKSITFTHSEDQSEVFLSYAPYSNPSFVHDHFSRNEPIHIRGTFYLSKDILTHEYKPVIHESERYEPLELTFRFAQLDENGYYRISKSILDTKHDIFIHRDIDFEEKIFVAEKRISVFLKIDKICDEEIFIGGVADDTNPNAIPQEAFKVLIKKFPTPYELTLYAESRVSNILKEYLSTMIDAATKLENFYKNKGKKLSLNKESKNIIPPELYERELSKYEHIRDYLIELLDKGDNIEEVKWQNFLKEFLLLIFPQYIAILKNVIIQGEFLKQYKIEKREIDFVFVNANGYIDIVEVKRPFEDCILSIGEYRKNFYPKRELSGTIMQVEKYLLYLNMNAMQLEVALSEKHRGHLPEKLNIKIRNPRAKVILGRSNLFDERQKLDFEIIKRKYSNVADIMSYDDVLSYLDNIIACLRNKSK